MSSSRQPIPPRLLAGTVLALSCALAPAHDAHAQTVQTTAPAQASAQPVSAATAETDAAQKRLTRARSLAAIGKLAAAAGELESLRAATQDESVRDVARVLLMAILVEMPDYPRAMALLDESFRARPSGQAGDAATHSYFAIAGQMVNAVRTHLERYRAFGVNVADSSELPPEAAGDVEQLRGLLDRVVEQAKALHAEQLKGPGDGARGLDAAALREDAATVRMRIARHDQDRARWQAEVSEARQHLFSSEMRVASISELPATRPAPAPAAAAAASRTTAPAQRAEQRTADAAAAKRSSAPAGGQSSNAAANSAQPSNAATNSAPSPAAAAPAAAPAAGGSPVSVGSLVGKARQRVAPSYPQLARAARVSGAVVVYLVVNEKGDVEAVHRADGPPQLQAAAVEAARRWKFNPTVVDGQPVRVSGFLSFNFAL